MKVYLIRHAESENNTKPPEHRIEDPSITDRGHLQARCLADWLATIRYDHLITSPFRRTLQTTRHVVDRNPRPLCVWHHVFERGGCYSGHHDGNIVGRPGLSRKLIPAVVC